MLNDHFFSALKALQWKHGAKFLVLLCLLFCGQGKMKAQTFPDGLALIEFLQGVNSQKIPENLSFHFRVNYLSDNKGPESGYSFYKTGTEHFVIYDEELGLNAKVHIEDSLVIILKSEKIFETERIDVENLMQFGIHMNEAQKTVVQLQKLGIDTDVVDEGIRLGRPMWIIGAARRDMDIPQIWIDKERLVVKKIHYLNLAQKNVEQMEWDDFREIGEFYFPASVEFRSDPRIFYRLKRDRIEINTPIPEKIRNLKSF